MKNFSKFILAGVITTTLGFSTVSVYAGSSHMNGFGHNQQQMGANYYDHQYDYHDESGEFDYHTMSGYRNNQLKNGVIQTQGLRLYDCISQYNHNMY